MPFHKKNNKGERRLKRFILRITRMLIDMHFLNQQTIFLISSPHRIIHDKERMKLRQSRFPANTAPLDLHVPLTRFSFCLPACETKLQK